MAEEWTVVGGGGRPRKPKAGGSAAPAAAAARHPQVHADAGAASAAGAVEQQHDAPASVLPGWAMPPGDGGASSSAPGAGGQRRGGRRSAPRARTDEERLSSLHDAVVQCRAEVEASAFFRALVSAMKAAAQHRHAGRPASHANAHASTSSGEGGRSGVAAAAASSSCPGDDAGGAVALPSGAVASCGFGAQAAPPMTAGSAPQEQQDDGHGATNSVAAGSSGAGGAAACGGGAGQHPSAAVGASGAGKAQEASTGGAWSGWSLVVYGLGSPEDSKVSRYQLALATLLAGLVAAPGRQGPAPPPPQLYDPAFSSLDRQLLARLGMEVIEQDERGARRATSPTLFYLPHCEAWLCNNLLAANWGSAQQLAHVAILGNSFSTYVDRWALRRNDPGRPARLLQCSTEGWVHELPVPDLKFPIPSAFNDMGMHAFSEEQLVGSATFQASLKGQEGS